MPKRSSKSPDPNKRAFQVVQEATEEDISGADQEQPKPKAGKNPAAVALGRLGGKKGGKARADALSAERKREIAQKAALKRWEKKNDEA